MHAQWAKNARMIQTARTFRFISQIKIKVHCACNLFELKMVIPQIEYFDRFRSTIGHNEREAAAKLKATPS